MKSRTTILLVRTKSIGDIVFTIPAVNYVRSGFPDAEIAFLTSCEFRGLVEAFDGLDRVLCMDRHSLRSIRFAKGVAYFCRLLGEIRTGRFDLVVDFQNYGETAALARWSGAPERIGFASRKLRARAFTSHAVREGNAHPIDENLSLLRDHGVPGAAEPRNSFVVPEQHVERARAFLDLHGVDRSRPIVFLQPLTSSAWKNWPLDRYLGVAREFRSRGLPVLIGGGPGDRETLSGWADAGYPVTTGETLMTDAGLMQLSSVVVGGDTGLLHLAVAAGRRVVVLMWSKDSNQPIPFRQPEWVITPAANAGLDSIGEREVIERVSAALSAG